MIFGMRPALIEPQVAAVAPQINAAVPHTGSSRSGIALHRRRNLYPSLAATAEPPALVIPVTIRGLPLHGTRPRHARFTLLAIAD